MQDVYAEDRVSGCVESISFCNEENGFAVLELNTGDELITAVGIMPFVAVGEMLELSGGYETHPSFGVQFKVQTCERSMPETAAAILHYLSSGAVRGIGPATARTIVDAFGADTLEVIGNNPERLTKIKGITPRKAQKIAEEYRRQFGIRDVMLALGKWGITPEEAMRIFQSLGSSAADRVRLNPYLLCSEELRFSFDRADTIARELHLPADSEERIRAGIIFILRHNLGNGHTCLPGEKLLQAANKMLEQEVSENILEKMTARGELSRTEYLPGFVFLPSMLNAEIYAANRLALMLKYPPEQLIVTQDEIKNIEKEQGIEYQEIQREAIKSALARGILILTGGPGTGKTTTLNAIIQLFIKRGLKLALCAPTGRAAKRMTELTGKEAKTIHRLLEVEWGTGHRLQFQRCEQNPLDCDVIIADELSMVDSELFECLLRAMKLGCRLIMVGDSDQLPSVGAGNVLHDMIASEKVPLVRLTEIFRQAYESLIVRNSHKIVSGETPELRRNDSDFFFIGRRSGRHALDTVTELCCDRLPAAYGYDPLTEIQVLCPSRKRSLGTATINNVLQQRLNPPSEGKKELPRPGFILREGDKVIQTRNNYDIPWSRPGEEGDGIFNGDIGVLERIDRRSAELTVRFEDRTAIYSGEQAGDLELAYAMTIHKSQGSEFECVILPLLDVVPQLTYRNLLYTAVTRAKKQLIIVGSAETVSAMAKNHKKTLRYTALERLLTIGAATVGEK